MSYIDEITSSKGFYDKGLDLVNEKEKRLVDAREAKLAKLGYTNKADQYDSLGSGTTFDPKTGRTYSNHNKIYNDMSYNDVMELVGESAKWGYDYDKKIYTDENGNTLHGKIGGLYFADSVNGDKDKVKPGYFTIDADSGLSPQEQLEANYDKHELTGLTNGFIPKRDGASILVGDSATMLGLEGAIHGNTHGLEHQVYSKEDYYQRVKDGKGRSYSEIKTKGGVFPVAGLSEDEINAGGKKLTLEELRNIALKKSEIAQWTNAYNAQIEADKEYMANYTLNNKDLLDTVVDSTVNVGTGLVRGAVSLADGVIELGQWGANKLVDPISGKTNTLGTDGVMTDEQHETFKRNLNGMFGYDSWASDEKAKYTQKLIGEATKDVDWTDVSTYTNVNGDKLLKAMQSIGTNYELIAGVVGESVGQVGVSGKAASVASKGLSTLTKEIATNEQRIAKLVANKDKLSPKRLEYLGKLKQKTLLKKAKASAIATAPMTIADLGEQAKQYTENNGGVAPDTTQLLSWLPTTMAVNMLDGGLVNKQLKGFDLAKETPTEYKKWYGKLILQAREKTGVVVKESAEELGQEFLQNTNSELHSIIGTEEYKKDPKKALSEAMNKVLYGTMLAPHAAAHTVVAGEVGNVVKNTIASATGKKEEAIDTFNTAVVNGADDVLNTDNEEEAYTKLKEVATGAAELNDKHKLVKDMYESTDMVIDEILTRAINSGKQDKIDKAINLMLKADQDTDVPYTIRDTVNDGVVRVADSLKKEIDRIESEVTEDGGMEISKDRLARYTAQLNKLQMMADSVDDDTYWQGSDDISIPPTEVIDKLKEQITKLNSGEALSLDDVKAQIDSIGFVNAQHGVVKNSITEYNNVITGLDKKSADELEEELTHIDGATAPVQVQLESFVNSRIAKYNKDGNADYSRILVNNQLAEDVRLLDIATKGLKAVETKLAEKPNSEELIKAKKSFERSVQGLNTAITKGNEIIKVQDSVLNSIGVPADKQLYNMKYSTVDDSKSVVTAKDIDNNIVTLATITKGNDGTTSIKIADGVNINRFGLVPREYGVKQQNTTTENNVQNTSGSIEKALVQDVSNILVSNIKTNSSNQHTIKHNDGKEVKDYMVNVDDSILDLDVLINKAKKGTLTEEHLANNKTILANTSTTDMKMLVDSLENGDIVNVLEATKKSLENVTKDGTAQDINDNTSIDAPTLTNNTPELGKSTTNAEVTNKPIQTSNSLSYESKTGEVQYDDSEYEDINEDKPVKQKASIPTNQDVPVSTEESIQPESNKPELIAEKDTSATEDTGEMSSGVSETVVEIDPTKPTLATLLNTHSIDGIVREPILFDQLVDAVKEISESFSKELKRMADDKEYIKLKNTLVKMDKDIDLKLKNGFNIIKRLQNKLAKSQKQEKLQRRLLSKIKATMLKMLQAVLKSISYIEAKIARIKKTNKKLMTISKPLKLLLEGIAQEDAKVAKTDTKTVIGTIKKEHLYGTEELLETEDGYLKKLEEDHTALIENSTDEGLQRKLVQTLSSNLKQVAAQVFKITKSSKLWNTGLLSKSVDEIIELLPDSMKDFVELNKENKNGFAKDIRVLAKWMTSIKVPEVSLLESTAKVNKKNNLVPTGLSKIGKELGLNTVTLSSVGLLFDANSNKGKLVLPEEVQEMVKFQVAKMIGDYGKLIEDIQTMDERDLAKLGASSTEEMEELQIAAKNGYVPMSLLKKGAGKEIYKELGIKVLNEHPQLLESSIIAGLETIVELTAVEAGIGEFTTMKDLNNESLVNRKMVKIKKQPALAKAMNSLQYIGSDHSRSPILLRKPKPKTSRKVTHRDHLLTEEQNRNVDHLESIGYKFNDSAKSYAEALQQDKKAAMTRYGYKPLDRMWKAVEDGKVHIDVYLKQKVLNEKIERETDVFIKYYSGVNENTFYLPWAFNASNRYNITSDLNYQESKIHRELISAVDTENTTKIKDLVTAKYTPIKGAIAQGLDLDPDKKSDKTVADEINKLVKITSSGVVINVDTEIGEILNKAVEAIKKDGVGKDELEKLFDEGEGAHAIKVAETLVKIDAAIKAGKEDVETDLKLETDAITSGVVLTLMQVATEDAWKLAEKGGVYSANAKAKWSKYVTKHLGRGTTFTAGALIEAGKKHLAELEAKIKDGKMSYAQLEKMISDGEVFLDLYTTVGVRMLVSINEMYANIDLTDAKEGSDKANQAILIQSVGEIDVNTARKLAKSPVMVFVYGATSGAIKRKLNNDLVELLIKKELKADKPTQFRKLIDQFIINNNGNGVFLLENGKKANGNIRTGIQYLNTKSFGEFMLPITSQTFGKAIDRAFDTTFKDVVINRDKIKQAELLSFAAYKTKLMLEVDRVLSGRNVVGTTLEDKLGNMSKDDMTAVVQRLQDAGFVHGLVDTLTGNVQVLNKSDKTTSDGLRAGLKTAQTNSSTYIEQLSPVSSTGAAPTISIHSIDGRLIMDALTTAMEGEYTGENIYDAIIQVLDANRIEKTVGVYNDKVAKIGMERSILTDSLTHLHNMLEELSKSDKAMKLYSELLRRDSYINSELDRLGYSLGKISDLLMTHSDKDRTKMAGKVVYVQHMAMPGTKPIKTKLGTPVTLDTKVTTDIMSLVDKVNKELLYKDEYRYVLDVTGEYKDIPEHNKLAEIKKGKVDFRSNRVKAAGLRDRILILNMDRLSEDPKKIDSSIKQIIEDAIGHNEFAEGVNNEC